MVDEDAIDPLTGKHIFYDLVKDENDTNRKVFKSYQSVDHVAIAAISIKAETRKLLKDMFAPFFSFTRKLEINGLDAKGNKPMFLPFKFAISHDIW